MMWTPAVGLYIDIVDIGNVSPKPVHILAQRQFFSSTYTKRISKNEIIVR